MQDYRIKIEYEEDGTKVFWPQHKVKTRFKTKWHGFDIAWNYYERDVKYSIKDVDSWGSGGGNGVYSEECAREVIEVYKKKLKRTESIKNDEFIYLN